MRCTCGAPSRLQRYIGERERPVDRAMNVVPRRRECQAGHVFVTYEVHEAELLQLRRAAYLGAQQAAWATPSDPEAGIKQMVHSLAAQGLGYRRISERLGLSARVVRGYMPQRERTVSAAKRADRKQRVHELAAQGLGYREISRRLDVPCRTVRCDLP